MSGIIEECCVPSASNNGRMPHTATKEILSLALTVCLFQPLAPDDDIYQGRSFSLLSECHDSLTRASESPLKVEL